MRFSGDFSFARWNHWIQSPKICSFFLTCDSLVAELERTFTIPSLSLSPPTSKNFIQCPVDHQNLPFILYTRAWWYIIIWYVYINSHFLYAHTYIDISHYHKFMLLHRYVIICLLILCTSCARRFTVQINSDVRNLTVNLATFPRLAFWMIGSAPVASPASS